MAKKKSTANNTSKTISKERNISYKICIFYNGKMNTVLLETNDRTLVMNKYRELLGASKRVELPKIFISSRGIKPLHSELLLLKTFSKKSVIVNTPPERIINGWKVVKREDYNIEETFTVFGVDKKLTAREIIQHLNQVNTPHREIGVLNNKVVVFNESYFDLFVAKCPDDAVRLQPFIYNNGGKHKNFFNRGIYQGYTKTSIIDLIVEETEWSRDRVLKKLTDYS